MSLAKLTIHHIRNIQQARLQSLARINVFYGEMARVKTSVLESDTYARLGRSFSVRTKSIIQKDAEEAVLFAAVGEAEMALGMARRRDGKHQIKIAGEKVMSSGAIGWYSTDSSNQFR